MRMSKQPPKASPPSAERVLSTNREIADWPYAHDRQRKLKRVAACERECHILRNVADFC